MCLRNVIAGVSMCLRDIIGCCACINALACHTCKCINVRAYHTCRCIKPNVNQVPDKFSQKLVARQLEYSGVLQIAKIARVGYPARLPFGNFVKRQVPHIYICILYIKYSITIF